MVSVVCASRFNHTLLQPHSLPSRSDSLDAHACGQQALVNIEPSLYPYWKYVVVLFVLSGFVS
jgi:hypothetical protein